MENNLSFNYVEAGKIPAGSEELNDLFVSVPLNEEESEHITTEPYSYWKSVLRVFIKKPAAIISISLLVLLLLAIIIIPLATPAHYIEIAYFEKHLAPSVEHIWGTDALGRDMFFGIWTSASKSLWLALIESAIILTVGTLFGLAWGYFRKLDPIFIELYNLIVNIPSLLVYMLLATVFSSAFPDMTQEVRLIVSLCLTGWVGEAFFIRNQVLIINNREYNVASKTLGTPARRIMSRNLLPFLLAVVITNLSLTIPGMISSEVSMSYFGVGLNARTLCLGGLLASGDKNFDQYWWELAYPAIVLGIIILIFFLMGMALSDALDPKKHR